MIHKGWLQSLAVADPGFPVGCGGHGPPTQALFAKNVCENERSVRRARPP